MTTLGPTPAYDAAIKAAREDGMEAAARIAEGDPFARTPRQIATAIRAAKDQPA